MRLRSLLAALAAACLIAMPAKAGDHAQPQDNRPFLHRLAPVGGLNPDGRGLSHWWDPHCFPSPCGPNDYCPKPFPRVCWRPAVMVPAINRSSP